MNETSIHNATRHLSSDSEHRKSCLTFRLQLVAVADSDQQQVQEVGRWEREGVQLETLGLTLAELKNIQESVIQQQVNESLTRQRCCPDCGECAQARGCSIAGASRMRRRASVRSRICCPNTSVQNGCIGSEEGFAVSLCSRL